MAVSVASCLVATTSLSSSLLWSGGLLLQSGRRRGGAAVVARCDLKCGGGVGEGGWRRGVVIVRERVSERCSQFVDVEAAAGRIGSQALDVGAASSSLVVGEDGGSSMFWGGIERGALPLKGRGGVRGGGALGSSCLYGMATETVRWGLAAAATLLLLKRNPGVRKQFIVPILALEAPAEVVNWIKSEYGMWIAFVGLSLRLFYSIPAELDFPLGVYLFISTAPAQAVAFRGSLGRSVVSTVLAVMCAYQYFTVQGGIRASLRRESLVNTIAISVMLLVCIGFFSMLAI